MLNLNSHISSNKKHITTIIHFYPFNFYPYWHLSFRRGHLCNPIGSCSAIATPLSTPYQSYRAWFTLIHTKRLVFLPLSTPIYFGKAPIQPYPQLFCQATPFFYHFSQVGEWLTLINNLKQVFLLYPHLSSHKTKLLLLSTVTKLLITPIHPYLLREDIHATLFTAVHPYLNPIHNISLMLWHTIPLFILYN